MDSNFITNREKPNKDIIAKYLDDFHISSYLIHADIDMRTETDIFNECKTIAEYKRYISKFPSGKFVKEAENRIKLLTKQDDDYWEICYKGGNYSEYLCKYPSGRHSNEAKSKIEQEDDNYWEICNKSGDYMLYVKKYPEGIHTDEAYRKDAARKAAVFTVIFIIVIIASLIFYTISRQ